MAYIRMSERDERPYNSPRRSSSPSTSWSMTHVDGYSTSGSQLFSLFVSLASAIGSDLTGNSASTEFLSRLQNRDLGIMNIHLVPLGYGSTFFVSVIPKDEDIPASDSFILKRTIPSVLAQSEQQFQKRIKAIMLELRILTHNPIRQHENIVRLLALTWETDSFDQERRWPVLILERAERGTLLDFLENSGPYSYEIKLALSLDCILGLEVLHRCGILHGDVKLDNVLVFDNKDVQSRLERPVVAKLADFNGALFDINSSTALPTGTRPWNAPEWLEPLEAESLLKTDIYSLGFLIWRVFADGSHPFLDFPKEKIEEMKKSDERLFSHLTSILAFKTDIDMEVLKTILNGTLRFDPELRRLDLVKAVAQHAPVFSKIFCRPPPDLGNLATQLRDLPLPLSIPDIEQLDPAVSKYVSEQLVRTAESTNTLDQASEAAYGLAVLYMNRLIKAESRDKSQEIGLQWLEKAALGGCDRAQAVFYRICRALERDIPVTSVRYIPTWLTETGSKGFFVALEDLQEIGSPGLLKNAKETLRRRYGGTGSARYDDDYFPSGYPSTAVSFDLRLCERFMRMQSVKKVLVNRFGDNILHFAAACGLETTVMVLLNQDFTCLNTTNINGETPLLLACRSGHFPVSMHLLQVGADPNIASDYGEVPLHWLLSFETESAVQVGRKIFENGADLNAVASRWAYIHCGENVFIRGTSMMRAITRGRLDIVNILLELGADPNFTVDGASAINLAAQLHYPHILESLLSKSHDEPVTVEQSTERSLLLPAITGGSLQEPGRYFERVRRHGSHWQSRARETLQVLLDRGASDHLHDIPGFSGGTALVLGVLFAELDVVKYLLDHGCVGTINTLSTIPNDPSNRFTPLIASIYSRKLDIFHILLEYGANARSLHDLDELTSVTALYECARHSHEDTDFAQTLIDLGVPVDDGPDDYETPFGCALRNRCFKLAECLLLNGANMNAEYSRGLFFERGYAKTVLGHLVDECSVSSVVCLNFLLRSRDTQSANFIVSSSTGLSILHALALIPHPKQDDRASALILDCIMRHFNLDQSQLNLQCSDQEYTALHMAVWKSNYRVVRGLLHAGAVPLLKDAEGHTALDLARRCLSDIPESSELMHSVLPREKLLELRKKRLEDIVQLIQKPPGYPV